MEEEEEGEDLFCFLLEEEEDEGIRAFSSSSASTIKPSPVEAMQIHSLIRFMASFVSSRVSLDRRGRAGSARRSERNDFRRARAFVLPSSSSSSSSGSGSELELESERLHQ